MATMAPISADGYRLFHEGAIAMAQVEQAGMRVDTDYIERTIKVVAKKVTELEDALKQDNVYKVWTKRYGSSTDLGSKEQIKQVIYGDLGYRCEMLTNSGVKRRAQGLEIKTGSMAASEEAFKNIDLPFIKNWLKRNRLKDKIIGTYLKGLLKETVDGFIHPSLNLHTVWTMRGSCSEPNTQNVPARDGENAQLVRTAFIPRDGHCLVENDFKASEVMASACYHHDPVWMAYCEDASKDMHRDSAMRIFCIDQPEDVSKAVRNEVKANFVFASMYGSYYVQTASKMWDQIDRKKLEVCGVPLKQHLRKHGIKGPGAFTSAQRPQPGTFEDHVQKYEQWYWKVQYKVYDAWKTQCYNDYIRNGYVDLLTGFRLGGYLKKNQVLDAPPQGTSFHFLLFVLIRMNKWLARNRMRSRVICQIHDSLIGDVHKDEVDDYIGKVRELVIDGLRHYWPWICVPITVECEVSPIDGNWFQKKEIKL